MAVDFDFDTNYNDDDDNQPEEEYAEDDVVEEEELEEESEEEPKKSNPLRMILLVLVILLLLCAVCYLGSRFIPIPGLNPASPPPPPAQEEPVAPPTEEEAVAPAEGEAVDSAVAPAEGEVAPPAEGEAVDGAVAPVEGEVAEGEAVAPAEGEVAPPTEGEAVDGAVAPAEGEVAEGEAVAPAEGEAADGTAVPAEGTGESGIIVNVTPVAGPTATPGPNDAASAVPGTEAEAAVCDDTNQAPAANAGGPYEAMMDKDRAIVTFAGTASSDADGSIAEYVWDFGDGSPTVTGEKVMHGYTEAGSYIATLTVTDNCNEVALVEVIVTITEATPPANDTTGGTDGGDNATGDQPLAPAPVGPPVDPAQGTLGFCYLIQRGDTLYGLAKRYGVPWGDLAYVNGVSPEYYVKAGLGFFIPVRPITPGTPNLVQVEPGDTVNSLAYMCGTTVTELAQLNGISPDSALVPGQTIVVPPPFAY
jgi:LysM repeat protein